MREHRVGKPLSYPRTEGNRGFEVDFVFVEALFREFSGQKLLCCFLSALVCHGE